MKKVALFQHILLRRKDKPKTLNGFLHVKGILFLFKVKTRNSRSICTSSTCNYFSIIVKFSVIIKPKELMFNIIIFHCRLWKISSLQKIPSDIEVAPPLNAAYTIDTVNTGYAIQTA